MAVNRTTINDLATELGLNQFEVAALVAAVGGRATGQGMDPETVAAVREAAARPRHPARPVAPVRPSPSSAPAAPIAKPVPLATSGHADASVRDPSRRIVPAVLQSGLTGTPQLVVPSGERLPIILGMLAFASRRCVLLRSDNPILTERARDVLLQFGMTVDEPGEAVPALSASDWQVNRGVGEALRMWLAERGNDYPQGLLWNCNLGTKPMALGLTRALGAPAADGPLRAQYYLDTNARAPALPLCVELADGTMVATVLPVQLNIAELLRANGWTNYADLRMPLNTPLPSWAVPKPLWSQPRTVRDLRIRNGRSPMDEFFMNAHQIGWVEAEPGWKVKANDDEWISLALANAARTLPAVSDVRLSVQVGPRGLKNETEGGQDLDVVIAANNTLLAIECKTCLHKTDHIFKIQSITERCGGRLAVPVLAYWVGRDGKSITEPFRKRAKDAKVVVLEIRDGSSAALAAVLSAALPTLA